MSLGINNKKELVFSLRVGPHVKFCLDSSPFSSCKKIISKRKGIIVLLTYSSYSPFNKHRNSGGLHKSSIEGGWIGQGRRPPPRTLRRTWWWAGCTFAECTATFPVRERTAWTNAVGFDNSITSVTWPAYFQALLFVWTTTSDRG